MASNAAVAEDWQAGEQRADATQRPAATAQEPQQLQQDATNPAEQHAEQYAATAQQPEPTITAAAANTAQQASDWQLSITQGLHQGGLATLREGALLVVGSGDDCDIQLFDDGVAARHLALIMRDSVVSARALDGAIAINAKPAAQGVQPVLSEGDKIGLAEGSVQLLLGRCFADAEAAASGAQKVSDADADHAAPPSARSGPLRKLLLSALAVALFTALTATLLGERKQLEATNTIDKSSVQALLAELNLQDEISIDAANAGVTLRGTLGRESLARLHAALRANNMRVQLAIGDVEQMLEQVRDVFRTNGYGARLKYLGAGHVQVENLDAGNKEVQKVAEYVKQDVTDLGKLSFAAFEQADSTDAPQLYIPPSGKRLTTIIDGDTAYVATEDGARYFTGSVLPGGFHIRRITANGVQADKDGVITWLRF